MGLFIFIIVFVVVVLGIALYKHNEMVASGEIAQRSMEFMYKVQCYTLNDTPDDRIVQSAADIITPNMKVLVSGYGSDYVLYSGKKWTARLECVDRQGGKVVWTLTFIDFVKDGMNVVGAIDMNRLTTALEKMFLSIDSNVLMQTFEHDYKIKRM